MKNAIEVKSLSKKFKDFSLNNISFDLPKGYIVGLIGENGAGKTSLIKSILGIIKPDSGDIKVLDQTISDKNSKIKENIGVVLDDIKLYAGLKVNQVESIIKPLYHNWDSNLFSKTLSDFNISKEKKVKDLSRGMKMKLQLAIALAHDPKLLIFDEATSGLDPVMRDEFNELMLDYIQDEENSVLISSHNINDLERIADYILFLHNGRIILFEDKNKLLENFGVIRTTQDKFDKIDSDSILASKENGNLIEILINNYKEAKNKYTELIVDKTNLDEIMLIYLKGKENVKELNS